MSAGLRQRLLEADGIEEGSLPSREVMNSINERTEKTRIKLREKYVKSVMSKVATLDIDEIYFPSGGITREELSERLRGAKYIVSGESVFHKGGRWIEYELKMYNIDEEQRLGVRRRK